MESNTIQLSSMEELPKEVRSFLLSVKHKHLEKLEPSQLIEQFNMRISLDCRFVFLETQSCNFIYDRDKGIEQFI